MRGYQVSWMPGLRRGGAGPGAWGTLDSCFPIRVTCVASKRFGLGAKNEERESKTSRKMAQVRERGGGGEERKETN